MSEHGGAAANDLTITITQPGIYDLTSDVYHADPAETPSLSAGMITDLLLAPAKCRENSRRLNPDYEEPEDDGKFTIGTVSHVIFLEPHLFDEKVVVVDHPDWRTGAAKGARIAAKATGRTAILSKHMDKVHAARAAFMAHPLAKHAFTGGKFEQSLFWKHPQYGFWCRCRPDFLADAMTHVNDYKATTNADPAAFGKHAYNMGYHRRAAWYLEGVQAITGTRPAHYWFTPQETKAPYLPAVVELTMTAIEAGQMENDIAAGIFDRCLRTGDWYGYRHKSAPDRDLAFQADIPSWAYQSIDARS